MRKVSTDSTGPKISSRAIRCACETPVKTVGANQKPLAGRSQSAVQRSAPSSSPTSARWRIRSSCSRELIAPMSVFLSSGSPRRSVPSRRLSRATTSSAIDSCTSRREPAQHTWPWLKKMPLTMPSTAWSIGASSNTMLAALPPSSSVSFLPVPATERAIALPDLGGAGEGDLVDVGVLDERAAGLARAGDDVDDARREVGLLADLGEEQRGERRGLGGLEHHGVAGGERRRDLPRQHEQREVPRDDLRGDAERLRVGSEPGVLELVGPAGVVEEVRGDERDVDVARLLDRLAVVEGLEHRELARALLHEAGDAEEVLRALGAGGLRPHAGVGAARGRHGPVDVGVARHGDLGEHLLGGRVDALERRAGAVDELAVDEQAVRRGDVDDGPRLGRRCVLEGRGHGSSVPRGRAGVSRR